MHPLNDRQQPIWISPDGKTVQVIDQRYLPHRWRVADLNSIPDTVRAIREMYVRGAPLIGVTAAYGLFLAVLNAPGQKVSKAYLQSAALHLKAARPTAVNLAWAVDRVLAQTIRVRGFERQVAAARQAAAEISALEAENCRRIGQHGLPLIEAIGRRKGWQPVNVLTHCNAGWLACIAHGTATAPIYAAQERDLPLHVWVDETRPLNQGSRLTAWELARGGVPHTVITDNAGGHLMQHGRVDLVLVGTDRTTRTGDVANKIGTYLKALAARDNGVPFYVALPSSTFDWDLRNGVAEIPIEERDPDEVRFVQGDIDGRTEQVLVPPAESPAANFAFDVTPARLVTGFITERGICRATEADILRLFPEKA